MFVSCQRGLMKGAQSQLWVEKGTVQYAEHLLPNKAVQSLFSRSSQTQRKLRIFKTVKLSVLS